MLLLGADPAAADIALVQNGSLGSSASGALSETSVLAGPVQAGNLIIVAARYSSPASDSPISVDDGLNGSYALAYDADDPVNGRQLALFYIANSAYSAGPLTITCSVTFANALACAAAEYSGADVSSPLDGTAAINVFSTVGTTGPDSGFATPSQPGDLAYGCLYIPTSSATAVGTESFGFTSEFDLTNGLSAPHFHSAQAILSDTSAVTYAPTVTLSTTGIISLTLFKAADASVTDAGSGGQDAGPDAGFDGGAADAGVDAGGIDGGADASVDAGSDDGGNGDGGGAGSDASIDAGSDDGGADAGLDAGSDGGAEATSDAGSGNTADQSDAGAPQPQGGLRVGCDCSAAGSPSAWALAAISCLAAAAPRRRRCFRGRPMRRVALLFAAFWLVACGPKPTGQVLRVVETEEPGADWACSAAESCTADYLAFPSVAVDFAVPLSEDALLQRLADMDDKSVAPLTATLPETELEARIVEGLAVGFLQEGLDARELGVAMVGRSETDTYLEEQLLFRDPYVGTFKALMLTPKGVAGPFPALLALHGHGQDSAYFRDTLGGSEFPAHGFAMLMLTSRAMGIDADEHQVSHDLLRAGFSLMGLRVYEALLGLKYLRHRPDVGAGRIGFIGHSGGSSTGNLLVRLEPAFRAVVSDHQVDFHISGVGEPWHCETLPALYPLNYLINDFTTAPRPVWQTGYGYPEGLDPLYKFFGRRLAAP